MTLPPPETTSYQKPVQKRWRIAPTIPSTVDAVLKAYPPLLRQLLFNRGITSAEAASVFVQSQMDEHWHPFNLLDMEKAVNCLSTAIHRQDHIVIYGDYDVDGVTGSALLVEFISKVGGNVQAYIPDRFEEGYGLNLAAMQQLADGGANCLIAVDCGIRSVQEVALAKQLGLAVIICDHHQPADELPPADAIINPKQTGDVYPEKQLAGVGLAYKLAQAYLMHYPCEGISADDWLDLVALGTVADLAPLQGENRILVKEGLDMMRSTQRQGLFSLAQIAGINLQKISASHIGFMLGPRLNAAGRLESALSAFELLTTPNLLQAGQLAQQLDAQNRERQKLTREIQAQAVTIAMQTDAEAQLIFAAHPEFNEGVVGLAASRVTEMFYRPAVIGHIGDENTVASCRSIPEFHITRALDACADLLIRHGGHSAAAGFTVSNQNLPRLVDRLKQIAADELGKLALSPEIHVDRIIKLENVKPEHMPGIFDAINVLEPTGYGNPEPVFAARNLEVRNARLLGAEKNTLKMSLRAGSVSFDAIGFRMGYWYNVLPQFIDILFNFELNEFNGRTTLQLTLKDIAKSQVTGN